METFTDTILREIKIENRSNSVNITRSQSENGVQRCFCFHQLSSSEKIEKYTKSKDEKDSKSENFEPYKDLAGGHKKNFLMLEKGQKVLKFTNENEIRFYKEHRSDALSSVIPATFDIAKTLPNIEKLDVLEKKCVIMENLKNGMENPYILDIKIGSKTMSKFAQKLQGKGLIYRNINKFMSRYKNWYTGTDVRGFRIVGGTGLTKDRFKNGLETDDILKKLVNNKDFAPERFQELLEKLKEIREVTKSCNEAFVDSSVFIAIDKNRCAVKLIDFSLAFTDKDDPTKKKIYFNKYQSVFGSGIDSLIKNLEKLLCEKP